MINISLAVYWRKTWDYIFKFTAPCRFSLSFHNYRSVQVYNVACMFGAWIYSATWMFILDVFTFSDISFSTTEWIFFLLHKRRALLFFFSPIRIFSSVPLFRKCENLKKKLHKMFPIKTSEPSKYCSFL